MKDFTKKYLKWLILACLIFVFTFITMALFKDRLSFFDTTIYNFIISFKSPILTFLFRFITFLSSAPTLIVLSILLFIIFKNKKYGILSFINLIVIVSLNQILKHFFSRPRPFEWMLVNASGYSFPSGHAMVSTVFYGTLIFLIHRTSIKQKYKRILTIFLALLIFLICISRIYLGVHYVSDIIAGFALSLSYIIISTSIISYYLKKRNE